MNDPHVVALIYAVEHRDSVSYEKAGPLIRDDSPDFRLTVDDGIARFEFKTHYASKNEAREAISQYIQDWEFAVGIRQGPGRFKLRYSRSEVVDRNPSASGTTRRLRPGHRLQNVVVGASLIVVAPHYPSPPSGIMVDADVNSMYDRYVNYREKREPLPGMAYFCLTMLEYHFPKRKREQAAAKYQIDYEVLDKMGDLSAKGGPQFGRKAGTDPLTEKEEKWLKKSVERVIYRAAQVTANPKQTLPTITMSDLPNL